MKRRGVASLLLAAGYLLQLLVPARLEVLAGNDHGPHVPLLAPPPSCVESSLRHIVLVLAFAAAGMILFEIAKLWIGGSWRRTSIIALAQIVLPLDCVRAFAADWWFYFTGLHGPGPRWPIFSAIFTLAAIIAASARD